MNILTAGSKLTVKFVYKKEVLWYDERVEF